MQRGTHRLRRGLGLAAVAAGALGIGACGSSSKTTSSSTPASGGATSTAAASGGTALPGRGKPTFVIGDKNFAEEYILGDLYQQALEAKGYTVSLKPNIGTTEVTFAALKSGQIQGYPEYDGTLLTSVANIHQLYPTADATYAATTKWASGHGYSFSTQTPFEDADDIAVLKSYATKHHLSSIGDLKSLGKSVILSGAPEFQSRNPDGLLGVEHDYGVTPSFKPSSIGSFYTLLDNGSANAIAGFTTDPQLLSGRYTVLKDPKGIFGYQNVGLVAKATTVAAEGPAFLQTVNKVSALLTTNAMIALDKAVEVNQENPAAVAKAFLKANGLL